MNLLSQRREDPTAHSSSSRIAPSDLPLSSVDSLPEVIMASGVIGGRAWFLVNRYLHYGIPLHIDAIAIWKGGMAFQGGLFGGALGGIIYLLMTNRKPIIHRICDVVFSQLPLGIAIGRLGNFMNQEFMQPIFLADEISCIPSFAQSISMPLCIFAALTEGLLLFALTNYWIHRENYIPYQTTFVFLFGYGCMRLLNDQFRSELIVGSLKISEYVCIGLIVLSSIALLYQEIKRGTRRI